MKRRGRRGRSHPVTRHRDAAREGDVPVFYSPHAYEDAEYESRAHLNITDQITFDTRTFDVSGDGADFVPELEPDDNTFVLSPHKQLSGFWSNDVGIRLRQRGIDTIVLAGMSADLCVESHLRDAVGNGFEALTVTDAAAAAGEEALQAALSNYGVIAHETAEADDVVERLAAAEEHLRRRRPAATRRRSSCDPSVVDTRLNAATPRGVARPSHTTGILLYKHTIIGRMDRPSPSDRLAFKSEGVVIAVVAFALTRGTVADLLATDSGFATEVSAVLLLAVGFGVVLYGINLAVSARDRTYTRTVLVWFVAGAAGVGVLLGPLMTASSPGNATAAVAAVGIVGGGAGLLVGIRGAEAERRQATVDRQIEQARLLNRILRHEVRNSVTILRGHSELLFEEREETADRSKTAITDAIARIERAVDETRFLTVGTVDGGSALGPVRLDEAIRRHAERTGRAESAVSVRSVTVRADRYVDRLLDELVALPGWADAVADPLAVDVRDRYVELSVTAPGAWLSAREREVLVEGVPEQERNDVDYGVPVLRLLAARYDGDLGVDATGDATTVRVRLPRTDRTVAGSDTPGIASGTLWRTLGIGLAAGVAMGAFFQGTTGTLPVIGALYGASVSSVGWIAHLFHSAVFATVFTVARSELTDGLFGDTVGVSVAAGVAYGLFLWFVMAGVVMSLWLNAVGIATPIPNLDSASLVGHLLWGGLVGALSATLPPPPDRQAVRDRLLAVIGR